MMPRELFGGYAALLEGAAARPEKAPPGAMGWGGAEALHLDVHRMLSHVDWLRPAHC